MRKANMVELLDLNVIILTGDQDGAEGFLTTSPVQAHAPTEHICEALSATAHGSFLIMDVRWVTEVEHITYHGAFLVHWGEPDA